LNNPIGQRFRAQEGAADGEENVVAQPGGEGDVPAIPEFGGGEGEIGRAEVFGGVEAKQVREAAGDIGVAREVRQDLQGEAHRGGEGEFACRIRQVEDAADGGANAIGDDEFFEEAHHEQGPGFMEVFGFPDARRLDLRQEFLGAVHGTSGDLGEERHEEREPCQVTRGADDVARDVQHVGQFFQREEGESHGEEDAGEDRVGLNAHCGEFRAEGGDEESEIFEEGQHAEIESETRPDEAVLLLGFFEGERDPIIAQRGKPQQERVPRMNPAVENVTRRQQDQVLPGLLANEPVGRECDYEEEEEFVAGEVHGSGRDYIRGSIVMIYGAYSHSPGPEERLI